MDKIEYNNGVRERYTYDPLTHELHVQRSADVSANIEYSKALALDEDKTRQGIKDGMWHYGHIPNMIMEKWALMGVNINDTKELIKMINKPEYGYLKTTTKHHG